MTDERMNGRTMRSVFVWPGTVALVLWLGGLIVAGVHFVSLSTAARAATDGARIPGLFLGMPLFEGFHEQGRFGVHPEWGLLVLLIVPAAVGILMALAALRGLRHRG